MAVLAVAAAGAATGYGIFGSATFLGMSAAGWGWTLGSVIGNMLFAPDQPDQEGPRLADLSVQTSTEGAPLPQVWGTWRLAGNVVWSTDLVETRHEQEVGGKGGSGATAVSYTYTVSFAVALCEGPIGAVRRIWADGKLLWDVSASSVATVLASNARAAAIRIYTGSESQLADPTIQAHVGAADTPAYRGTAYIVFDTLQLADFANRIPNITVEVVSPAVTRPSLVATFTGTHFTAPISGSIRSIVETGDLLCLHYQSGTSNTIALWSPDGTLLETQEFSNGSLSSLHIWSLNATALGALAARPSAWILRNTTSASMYPPQELGSSWHTNATIYEMAGAAYILRPVPNGSVHNWYVGRFPLDGEMPALSADLVGYLFDTPTTANKAYGVDGVYFYLLDYSLAASVLYRIGPQCSVVQIWSVGDARACAGVFCVAGDRLYISGLFFGRIRDDGTLVSESSTVLTIAPTTAGMVSLPGLFWTLSSVASMDGIASSGTVPLSEIVGDVCAVAGLEPGDINVAALTDSVRGFCRARPMPARQTIEPLMAAFQSDAVESDGIIRWVKRGTVSATALTADDLCLIENADRVRTTRAQEPELPAELTLAFADADRDHQPGIVRARRIVTPSRMATQQDIPLLATSQEAARLADIMLRDAWRSRLRYEFCLPPRWIKLDATDTVALPVGDQVHTARITRLVAGPSGEIRAEAVSDSNTGYTSAAAGTDAGLGPAAQIIGYAGPTTGHVLDLPALRDQDDDAGVYLAAAGYLGGWRGAALYKSSDAQATWSQADALIVPATIGTTRTALAAGRVDQFDEANTLTLRLATYNGALSSASELSVLNGANAAAVGAHGRWEIIQYKTATQNADGSWTIGGLLRGRRGTEWAVGTHAIGDVFVGLAGATLRRMALQSSEIGAQRHYKWVTLGQALELASAQAVTAAGVSLECYAPVCLGGGRDASGNITLTWIRRARTQAEWRDYSDVPVGEASENYEVEIWDGAGYATLKRTLTGLSTPTASYTSAQQVTDFGANQATVYVRVYQVSAAAGRGYALQGSI